MAFPRAECSGPEKFELGSEVIQQELESIDEDKMVRRAYLQKFRLYETSSHFYIIGRDKSRTFWRLLKIDRLDPCELSIHEDPTIYSENECIDLLSRINEGNKFTGGLKFVTTCYGIVGFIKFLGPNYMLLITKRKKIGSICGHAIYTIAKSEMIPIPNATVRSNMDSSKTENRYKKLVCAMDLTKDFYFSYSYNIMLSLQKNISDHEARPQLYETLFVWNEFLTRGIRNELKNTLWTVALIYGFFKQVKLTVFGRGLILTLIARRSRHYAGTRYLRRGVNKKGRVANDVETEQIVCEDVSNGSFIQISSTVQIRGSIPLFWSQETSVLNIKPDIILMKNDCNYDATKLHFENLVMRYGNPIIILNLIKASEKKPRESILLAEFAHAIDTINTDLTEEKHLKFLHWDLNKYSKDKTKNVLDSLIKVASNTLEMTGFFYCHMMPFSRTEEWLSVAHFHALLKRLILHVPFENRDNADGEPVENASDRNSGKQIGEINSGHQVDITQHYKPLMFQQGVLRTNCIDCLDRTNVAQYCHGLVSLGNQLYALGFIDAPKVDLDSPLAEDLMRIYEAMGDTLALQYGGSAAHNKIFSQRRGQPKAVTQSQEFLRTLQRYYSNAYMDPEKQNAINVFLGHLQPQHDGPDFWELDSDQHKNAQRYASNLEAKSPRSTITRSLSDGNIPSGSISEQKDCCTPFIDNAQSSKTVISESKPEISTFGSSGSYPRSAPSTSHRMLFIGRTGSDNTYFHEHGNLFSCSNFLDVDWLSSSTNSCDEATFDRSALIGSSSTEQSSSTIASGMRDYGSSPACVSGSSIGKEHTTGDASFTDAQKSNVLTEYSETFKHWVDHGALLFP
ncbi:phosphatase [Lithospermum erythrorhizon]|uniref:Phosphatase n=1 Tax=Lithospermum erythrorhizon TaxID=34254 RepID=A0AAV3QT24_LITER